MDACDQAHEMSCPALAETVLCESQATGTYISRSLSYSGAEFAIIRVEVDPVFKVRLPTFLNCSQKTRTQEAITPFKHEVHRADDARKGCKRSCLPDVPLPKIESL